MNHLIGARKVPAIPNATGIWGLDELAKAKKDDLWPNMGDPYASYVALLLHCDGANNSTTFTDSSIQAVTVTAHGDAKISTGQSKFGSSSAYFDGAGDYLSFPNATNLNLLTGLWTYECFFYRTEAGDSNILCANGDGFYLDWVGNTFYLSYDYNNTTWSVTKPINEWVHIAVTNNNKVSELFINGVSQGTRTTVLSSMPAKTSFNIGFRPEIPTYPHKGYLDEIRLTSGAVRYTGNFIPPTAPF